jgi:hypothetical protein
MPRITWRQPTDELFILYTGPIPGSQTEISRRRKRLGMPWEYDGEIPINIKPQTKYSVTYDANWRQHVAMIGWLDDQYHVQETSAPMLIDLIPKPAANSRGDVTSIAVDLAGTAHVAWHDLPSGGLYYSTNGSGTWVTSPLDVVPGMDLGGHCAIAVHRPTGRLHVAYYDAMNGDLKYARKDPGGVWVRKVLDATGDVGSHASIAVDAAGAVHIAYRDETNRKLKIATGSP